MRLQFLSNEADFGAFKKSFNGFDVIGRPYEFPCYVTGSFSGDDLYLAVIYGDDMDDILIPLQGQPDGFPRTSDGWLVRPGMLVRYQGKVVSVRSLHKNVAGGFSAEIFFDNNDIQGDVDVTWCTKVCYE